MPLFNRQNMFCFFGALCLSLAGGWFSSWNSASRPDHEFAANHQEDEKPTFPPAEDIAKDWPEPDVVLFISGELHGYLEPCGCTGLDNQKGGLLRRHTAQQVLLDRGWKLISIDSGNTIRRVGVQANIQLETAYQTLNRSMNYDAISISHDDLKTSATDLAQIMVNSFERANPFVACNLVVLDKELSSPFLVVDRGGKKIAITSVIADGYLAEIKNPNITTIPAAKALDDVIPKLREQKCDMLVLIADASLDESRNLAKQFPVFDIVVTTGGAGDPTLMPELIQTGDHTTSMIQVGVKGMHVGLVGLFTNPKKEIRYERVPMDARFLDSELIKVNFKSYQDRLRQLYENPANFPDITPRNHPSGNEFRGSESCKECHAKEYDIWLNGVDGKGGPHARATRDLTDPGERVWVKRNFDPECLSCHVVGWNPQNFYPYKTGYLDLVKDKLLHGNGCENCHGPGSKHNDAENGVIDANAALLKQLQKEMQVTLKQAQQGLCMECHDLDNSPDFYKPDAFKEYWEKIKH